MKNYIYKQTQFLCSAGQPSQFPPDIGREVAFAGRSNSGKSSVINAITGRHKLAKVSKTPGRTRLLNFFSLSANQRLVDLPGYGYARVPAAMQHDWQRLTSAYITRRKSLRGLFLVTDIRRLLTEFDVQLLEWAADRHIPIHILLNKCDKLSRSASRQALADVTAHTHRQTVTAQLFSAREKAGLVEVYARLDEWL
jgi:GTP-binding protein